MAREVRNEHAVTIGESGREPTPVLDRPAEPVHEHERRPVPPDGVGEPRPMPREPPFIESLETVFAVRHHRGIFFGVMDVSGRRAE